MEETKKKVLTLTGPQTKAIDNAISYVWEVGFSDKTRLLVEAISALTSIETVLELARTERNQN